MSSSATDIREQLARYEELRRLEVAKETGRPVWRPLPHQIAPESDWYLWLLVAGRGAGKTDACAYYFDEFMRANPGARGGIIAPTFGDGIEACVEGPSGIRAHNPLIRVKGGLGGTQLWWPNGAHARVFGAWSRQDVDRLRAGGNRHIYWGEEVAAWPQLQDAWENMELGLRMGRNPRIVASTTPKTRPFLKKLMNAKTTMLTRASMHDNPHLPLVQRQRLIERYQGTRLEAQELLGIYLEDVEGALWSYETIIGCQVKQDEVPDLTRIVVAVDPSGGDEEGNDEQGIIIAGLGTDGHGYVLADRSCKLSPDGWGKRVVQAYLDHKADRVLGEGNFGGDMVVHTVRMAARDMGAEVDVKKISASRGKAARAEPVSALYEQGRVHHVGGFPELENR